MTLGRSTVLVTGAGGFIGSHLVESLLAEGADVRAFVKYNSRSDWGMLSDLPKSLLASVEVIHGDIRDPFTVRKAARGCDVVFHLAALIGIPYSYVAPVDYVTTNISGTVNILQACLDEQVSRVVHTSTSEVYGTARYVPINEDHPLQGQSPYSASKIAADMMAESYHRSYGLPVTTVRPFNTFGPRQSARAFIPSTIAQAITSERLSMGSLTPVRDLTYVKDTAQGFLDVGLCDDVIGRTVNLGVGVGSSIADVVKAILSLLGKEGMPIDVDPARLRPEKSEVQRLVSDNSIAREVCGWSPSQSFDEGLSETITWIRENIHLYRPETYAV
jgi:NAD dependent epimerase/dehydratase